MKFEKCLKTTSKKALHRFTALAAVLLAVCLVFMTPAAADSAFSGGSGTDSDPYRISTADDLKQLATDVNSGTTYEGKYFQLTQDITLSNEWTPIGNNDYNTVTSTYHYFFGTFDGNGKTIYGLSITNDNVKYIGLFGAIGYGGSVKNLVVSGNIDVTVSKGSIYVGGIAGYNGGNITNCAFIGETITANASNGGARVGGIAGGNIMEHNTPGATIENCYSICNVKTMSNGISYIYAAAHVGGIAGQNLATISNCYATGSIEASGPSANVGGIAGSEGSGKTINNCYALNHILNSTATNNQVTANIGRIAGTGTSSMKNNYGLKHMLVNNAYVTEDAETTNKNGASICAGAIQNAGWNSETEIWDMDGEGNYLLPVLTGLSHPDSTPSHIETVTVTFTADDGIPASSTQTILEGAKVVEPTFNPTKTGYTFVGWYKEEACTNEWDFETDSFCKDDTSKTLYAKWTPIQYTIKFDANGGSGTMTDLSVNYDEDKALTTNSFTKTGYTFTGWKSEDGTVTYSNDQNVKNLTSEPDGEVTLYAQWTANTYTVKFNANGGTGVMNNQTFTYDEEQPLAALNFTNGDKQFGGWATAADGEPVYADKATVKNLTAGANGVFNLYANWTDSPLPTYNVTFDSNGGSDVESQIVLSGQCATEPTTPTKTGYTFVGWENNSVEWNFADAVTQDITLVANWTANTYTVAFNANGGSGSMNPMSFTYGESQALTANGFIAPTSKVFNGWNTKADGSGTAYADKATVSDLTSENGVTVTLYAQWKPTSSGGGGSTSSTTKTTYTVTFNANGGEGEMFPQTFTSGKEKALNLNFFTKEGYTFAGWATSADGDVVYTDGETIKVSKSMTLYAVWESNEPVNPQQPGDNPEHPGDEPENPEKPTEPETPAPILAVLAGLGAAVILRRK